MLKKVKKEKRKVRQGTKQTNKGDINKKAINEKR
jgi:hypothetical protein